MTKLGSFEFEAPIAIVHVKEGLLAPTDALKNEPGQLRPDPETSPLSATAIARLVLPRGALEKGIEK